MNTSFAKAAFALLLCYVLGQQAFCAELPAGKVVWWGIGVISRGLTPGQNGGTLENEDEPLTNIISIAQDQDHGLALKNDGTVFAFGIISKGEVESPAGLSNVVSVAVAGQSCWAMKRDGTAEEWSSDPASPNRLAGLSNVVSITWVGAGYLALIKDGTVQGIHPDLSGGGSPIQALKVQGQILSNVVAIAAMGSVPLILKNDGKVYSLVYIAPTRSHIRYPGGKVSPSSSQEIIVEPIVVGGTNLNDVIAIAAAKSHALALKSNGMVVGWGNNVLGAAGVPEGLGRVSAIAVAEHQSLALKRDGTVAAWGDGISGQTYVPTGLSNVVAIAAGESFHLALTTGRVPPDRFTTPHGRLEIMERESDLVFKGRVISNTPITNAGFPDWGNPHVTKLEVISVLNGKAGTKAVDFLHLTHGPNAWGGGSPPPDFVLNVGESYILFAVKADKPDWLYSPSTSYVTGSDVLRQLMKGDAPIHTLDSRRLTSLGVNEAHWHELNLLLDDSNPTNQLYAIDKLDSMSLAGRPDDRWRHSEDFKRRKVLKVLLPLIINSNEQVASRAISCFAVESNAAAMLEPFADTLIKVANENLSSKCRLAAISSLPSGYKAAVSNSLSQLLKKPDENIRVGAVRLLPKFPGDFAEQCLRERADDGSANVRSVVADVIGDGKYERDLPTLVKLFADPVGKDPLIKPMTMEYLKAGQRWSNIGDVHTSAGLALVKFAPDQVADILKTNLDDPGFHINFVAKLAQGDTEPWLPELVGILEARCVYVDDVLKSPRNDPRRFSDPQADRVLIGAYTKCWEDIRQYLLKQSPEELASGKYDRYLDLLEKAVRPVPGCPGCSVQEARWLYQLYWNKNLAMRVSNLRRQFDKTDGWWFDDYTKRGEAAQVNQLAF